MLNKRPVFRKQRPLSAHEKKQLFNLDLAIDRECEFQVSLIYTAGAWVLYKDWDWRDKRINSLYKMHEDIYDEAINTGKSMVQILYDETGLELRRAEAPDVSFKDVKYLSDRDEEVALTFEQMLYMKTQKKKWVRTNILACFCISLHRKYGFGFERLCRLQEQILDLIWDYQGDVIALIDDCYAEIGFRFTDDPFTNAYLRMKEQNIKAEE